MAMIPPSKGLHYPNGYTEYKMSIVLKRKANAFNGKGALKIEWWEKATNVAPIPERLKQKSNQWYEQINATTDINKKIKDLGNIKTMFDKWRTRGCIEGFETEFRLDDPITVRPNQGQDLTIFVRLENPPCATDNGLAPAILEKTFRIVVPGNPKALHAHIEYTADAQGNMVKKEIPRK